MQPLRHQRLPAFMIVGTPRSGTTLVQRLAHELRGVRVPPETHFFSLFVRGLVGRRTFPLAGSALAEEVRTFLDLKTSRGLELEPNQVVEETGGACEGPLDLFAAIVRALEPDAEVLGEKTPNHLLWCRRLAATAPGLRFVVVVRDPRAVTASYRSTWATEKYWVTAQRWCSDQRRALALLKSVPDRTVILRYEDVVSDPAAARGAIARLVEVEEDPDPAAAPAFLEWETWKRGAAGAITTERVEAWRSGLSREERALVEHVCGGVMAAFGYRPGTTRRPSPSEQRDRLRFAWRRAIKSARIARTPLTGAGKRAPAERENVR